MLVCVERALAVVSLITIILLSSLTMSNIVHIFSFKTHDVS